ncbi:MAG: flagellar basal body P-ring formation chaperone FlgA [Pseudohongiella sp.]|uniref:flagellar basal body P-ring formation chaperone FlgA n=1 Tax=Pseudohongiella sp. TaxID=1979412 RepID=UPI0034A0146C
MTARNRQKSLSSLKAAAITTVAIIAATITSMAASQLSAVDSGSAEGLSGQQRLRQAALSELQYIYASEPGRVEIEVAALDPRLQVPVCQEPLQASLNRHSPNGGRVTVRIECRDQGPWTRHIAASVRIFQDVVVSSRALPRGSVLGPGDLSLQEHDISTLRGQVIKDPTVAVGQAVRRAVSADTVLGIDLLEAPILVSRGDTIVLVAERGSIAIRGTGTALQAGEAGKQIPVRNNSSERVVQAVVTGVGEAKVIF